MIKDYLVRDNVYATNITKENVEEYIKELVQRLGIKPDSSNKVDL